MDGFVPKQIPRRPGRFALLNCMTLGIDPGDAQRCRDGLVKRIASLGLLDQQGT
jgi:hypothetical protein